MTAAVTSTSLTSAPRDGRSAPPVTTRSGDQSLTSANTRTGVA